MKARLTVSILAILLLFGGWIVPKILPPYGVSLASSGLRNPYYFWNYVCIGEVGYFSQAFLVESTWEDGSHGHSIPVGTCLPASGVSLFVPVSAVLLLTLPQSRRMIWRLWLGIDMLLVLFGLHVSFVSWRFPWETLLLALIALCFGLYIHRLRRANSGIGGQFILSTTVLAFYPLWVGSLAITQSTMPYFGLLFTGLGCLALVWPRLASRQAEVTGDTIGSKLG